MGQIGIDFGTSRTKLAYFDERACLMKLGLGGGDRYFIPSLFYLGADDRIEWGEIAADCIVKDPGGAVDTLKRKLRSDVVRANKRRVAPVVLLEEILRGLRQQAGEGIRLFNRQAPDSVVLTIPARYGPPDREIMKKAATRAGFTDISLIEEPVAAARAWLAESGGTDDIVVVFDCGGGTIDWACVEKKGSDFSIFADCPPGGDEKIGGHDVDESILGVLSDKLSDDTAALDEIEKNKPLFLREACKLKERFCRSGALIPIKVGAKRVELSVDEVQTVLRNRFINQACAGLKDYLDTVREKRKIDKPKLLLVGGSAQMRELRESVEQCCNCEVYTWHKSEEATVLGAVIGATMSLRSSGRPQDGASSPTQHGRGSWQWR